MDDFCQSFCELSICLRIWCHYIHRTTEIAGCGQVDHRFGCIIEIDPAHVLLSVSQWPAGSHEKWRQHHLECATFAAEHYSQSSMHDAQTLVFCAPRCVFPIAAHCCKEAGSGS